MRENRPLSSFFLPSLDQSLSLWWWCCWRCHIMSVLLAVVWLHRPTVFILSGHLLPFSCWMTVKPKCWHTCDNSFNLRSSHTYCISCWGWESATESSLSRLKRDTMWELEWRERDLGLLWTGNTNNDTVRTVTFLHCDVSYYDEWLRPYSWRGGALKPLSLERCLQTAEKRSPPLD